MPSPFDLILSKSLKSSSTLPSTLYRAAIDYLTSCRDPCKIVP